MSVFEAAGLQVFERGWLSSNNILFDGGADGVAVLVDTGYSSHSAQTVALVKHALAGKPLTKIVNTHLHSDHCGGNAALQAAFGAAVSVPAGEAAKVDAWDEDSLTYASTGQHCPRFERTGSIAAGEMLTLGPRRWHVVAAPGHDPEGIVLYQPELELLISADALWENGFGVVFPELEGQSGFEDVRATLERMSKLPVSWVIPGHGRPFEDFRGAVDRAHRRLDGYVADPVHHARHAAKVLIKFRMLEVQKTNTEDLQSWLGTTPHMRLIHERRFASIPFRIWCASLIQDLANARAIRMRNGQLFNI